MILSFILGAGWVGVPEPPFSPTTSFLATCRSSTINYPDGAIWCAPHQQPGGRRSKTLARLRKTKIQFAVTHVERARHLI